MFHKTSSSPMLSGRRLMAAPRSAVLLCAFVLVGGGGIVARAFALWHASPAQMAAQGASPNSSRGPVQLLRFTLYDVGIVPQQTEAQKGNVTILFEDQTGNSTGLIVERLAGSARERTGQVERAPRSRYGKQQLRLEPGRYELYDASRPGNRALIVVEP